jgi:hypothetical protein
VQCFCVKGRGTFMPCRICQVTRDIILRFNASDLCPRNDVANAELLEFALPAYCNSLKGVRLSIEENRLLEWCDSQSLIPLLPALFKVPKPYPDFNIYSMGPYDLMHTITGILENWASTTAVCTVEVGKCNGYKDRYYDNIGRFDLKLANIPLKHGVPMNMKHFKQGISAIVGLRSNENDKRTGGGGSLGLIDSQDVPQLVLQMLLCTYQHLRFIFK